LRRQRNIEAITDKAIEALPPAVSHDPIEEDWIAHFFEQCQDISNERMQTLWGKLLAVEVERPGAFSPRTVSLVRTLRPRDAEWFTRFCTFVWEGNGPNPVIEITWASALEKQGLDFDIILHLQSIGLLEMSHAHPFALPQSNSLQLRYFGRLHTLSSGLDIRIGNVLLTEAGSELYRIAGGSADEDYRCNVVAWWRRNAIVVDEVDSGVKAGTAKESNTPAQTSKRGRPRKREATDPEQTPRQLTPRRKGGK
jgi:hypothetical protein